MPTYAPSGTVRQGNNNLYAHFYRIEATSDGLLAETSRERRDVKHWLVGGCESTSVVKPFLILALG